MKSNTLGRVLRAWSFGAIVGSTAGFAMGLLLAPEKGRTLRRRLAYQIEHLAEEVGQFIDDALHPDIPSQAREEGDALTADAEERAALIRQDLDDLLGEIRRKSSSR